MDLRQMTDETLWENTGKLVKIETNTLTSLLHHFREIERRRLFSKMGFQSMEDVLVRLHGYDEQQTYRRLAAMRLIHELPEIEDKVQKGDLNLTHLNLAQRYFNKEKKITQKEVSKEEKLEVLQEMVRKTTRGAEKIVFARSSDPVQMRPDKVQTVSENHVEMKFLADSSVLEDIQILKGRLAHKHPNMTLGELFKVLCQMGLAETDPSKTTSSKLSALKKRCVKNPAQPIQFKLPSNAQVRREVFQKAQNRCENCGSTHALQIDHIIPRAKGGIDLKENLRVLCRSCNQRQAIEDFGQRKMERYLELSSS